MTVPGDVTTCAPVRPLLIVTVTTPACPDALTPVSPTFEIASGAIDPGVVVTVCPAKATTEPVVGVRLPPVMLLDWPVNARVAVKFPVTAVLTCPDRVREIDGVALPTTAVVACPVSATEITIDGVSAPVAVAPACPVSPRVAVMLPAVAEDDCPVSATFIVLDGDSTPSRTVACRPVNVSASEVVGVPAAAVAACPASAIDTTGVSKP